MTTWLVAQTVKEVPEAMLAKFICRLAKMAPLDRDGCWIVDGDSFDPYYRTICGDTKAIFLHRLSYLVFNGSIPTEQIVHHTCEVKRCIQPKHLKLKSRGDHAETHADLRRERRRWRPRIG